ncbi:alpha/beta fold hydrolase [Bacterioplanoides sp.]|uniref:alpha/beta fold hydrolase n=1 Tax=Bacterioplanoides sp. TaxID=2066072 RepID=UPI003AFFBC63
MHATDVCFHTPFGKVAGLSWQDPQQTDQPVILALHGWLDNAATFSQLAPVLSQKYHVIAIDLPGHGHSDWLAGGGDYYIWEAVSWVAEVIRQLAGPVHLLGHSMGAATSIISASAYPDLVRSVVLLDAAGPLSTPADQAPEQLRKGIDDAIRRAKAGSRLKVYGNTEAALAARIRQDPSLSPECIAPVVERNLEAVAGGVQWCTDPRLRHTSKLRMTEDLVQSFMAAVECPVRILKAAQTFIPASFFEMRLGYLKTAQLQELPGHHHFHLEPETATAVANDVLDFYQGIH